jgi:regulatory protein
MDERLTARLRDVAAGEAARRVAMRLLATRPRTQHELSRKLRDRGHDARAIRQALDRMVAIGALDDAVFCERFTRGRLARGHGAGRVLTDLLARGVDRRTAERAIRQVSQEEAIRPAEQLERLIRRRVSVGAGLPADVRRRRLLSFLARRGFRGRQVQKAVQAALEGDPAHSGAVSGL